MSGIGFTLGMPDKAKAFFGSAKDTVGSFATQSGMSYMLPIIGVAVAITLIVLVVFVTMQVNVGRPKAEKKGPIDLFRPTSPVIIDRPTARAVLQNSYTLTFYIRIDAVPDMRATATPVFMWPGIWNMNYIPSSQELEWEFFIKKDDNSAPATQSRKVTVPNIPIQKWMQIAITFEGRTADFYSNGQLIESLTLDNMTQAGNGSITIIPDGVMGQVAYIQAWPRRLTISEIAANYTDTSDSQGRPFLGPDLVGAIKNISVPNLFCPSGNCAGSSPAATASQTWEFPYS